MKVYFCYSVITKSLALLAMLIAVFAGQIEWQNLLIVAVLCGELLAEHQHSAALAISIVYSISNFILTIPLGYAFGTKFKNQIVTFRWQLSFSCTFF